MRISFLKNVFLGAILALCCASCVAQGPSVRLKGATFSIEIADTSDKQELGLMFRDSMPQNHGMLFIFPSERARSFWMRNCRFPLDIIYFDKDLSLVNVARDAKPCRSAQCPSYPSAGPAMYVLELNAGIADELGLASGDRLEVRL